MLASDKKLTEDEAQTFNETWNHANVNARLNIYNVNDD